MYNIPREGLAVYRLRVFSFGARLWREESIKARAACLSCTEFVNVNRDYHVFASIK